MSMQISIQNTQNNFHIGYISHLESFMVKH